jgi:hypothetical protein
MQALYLTADAVLIQQLREERFNFHRYENFDFIFRYRGMKLLAFGENANWQSKIHASTTGFKCHFKTTAIDFDDELS